MNKKRRKKAETLFASTWIWEKGKRLAWNEDALYVRGVRTKKGGCFLYGICDGMGGSAHGREASAFVVERLDEWFEEQLLPILERLAKRPFWRSATKRMRANMIKNSGLIFFEEVNNQLFKLGKRDRGGWGTTASVCMIYQNCFYLFHVGDSAIFRFGQNGFRRQEGSLTKAHKKGHALTKCLGMNREGSVDFRWGRLGKNEIFLLCSDGFYGGRKLDGFREVFGTKLTEKSVENQKKTYQKRLLEVVESQMRRGEQDNLSAILAWRSYGV